MSRMLGSGGAAVTSQHFYSYIYVTLLRPFWSLAELSWSWRKEMI